MAILYADLYKPIKDFFTKNHTAGKATLETKTKAPGATFTGKLNCKLDKNEVEGETGFEYEFNFKEIPLKFKTEALTSGRVKAKLWADKLRPWLKTEVLADCTLVGSSKDTYELTAEAKNESYTLNSKFALAGTGRKLDLGASYLFNGIYLGVASALDLSSGALAKYGFGFRTTRGAYTIAALLEDAKSTDAKGPQEVTTFKLGVTTKVASGSVIGAEFEHNSASRALGASVGIDTTLQALQLKAVASSAGRITASFIQAYSPTLKLTYTSEFDLTKSSLVWGVNAVYDA